jgi:2-polyprenyl-3-methyl-5-hydroxy-6-metoxy-1,4-benzoquinol methylase
MIKIEDRAKDISDFLGVSYESAYERLKKGFHFNHSEVAKDFIQKNVDVNDGSALLNWYKTSDAYVWELSAYHLEEAFNYSGMCNGIASGLTATNRTEALVLGDGVGDLSVVMYDQGIDVTYHDLEDSLTALFAKKVFNSRDIKTRFTSNWEPNLGYREYNAVVALDFFEHLINVEEWVNAVHKCMKKEGAFIAQNAFAIGDAEHGNSIPMHLSVNNRFENDWGPLLESVGFYLHDNGTWWIKK